MKKRLLSLVLATSMLFGSMNFALANETSTTDEAVTVEDAAVVEDEVESGSSVVNLSDSASYGLNWSTTDPWLATVYGDAGGQAKMDFYGCTEDTWTYEDGTTYGSSEYSKVDGEYVMPYDVIDNGDGTVQMRMGVFDSEHNVVASYGKIASGNSDGRTYYYQELTSDDNFTISATAYVNDIDNTNSQVSFGAVISDGIESATQTSSSSNSVSAGYVQYDKATSGKMAFAFTRINGTIDKASEAYLSTLTAPPAVGDEVKISLKKAGTVYTVTVGDETTTIDGSKFDMGDNIYAGFYVSRAVDVTFSNVKLSVEGAAVELGDWFSGGNGLVGNSDKIGYVSATANDDNSEISLTLDTVANGEALGKLSSSEDSYGYYVIEVPDGEDYKLSSTIDSLIVSNNYPSSNPQQAGAGFIMFNEKYIKNDGTSIANSLYVGPMLTSSTDTTYDLVYRTVIDGKVTKTTIAEDIGSVGQELGPMDLSVKKSGDVAKVTIGEYTVDIDVTGICPDTQYVGYMVARDGTVEVSNNTISAGSLAISSVEIASMPEKTEYYVGQSFDATGLSFLVNYADGTSEIISDSSDYSLVGFDDNTNKTFATVGEKAITASIGSATCDVNITVRAMKVTSISVDYEPVYDTFYLGGKFNFDGLQISATFEDGTSSKLSSDEYDLYVGDTLVESNVTSITEDMVGEDVAVIVSYAASSETIDAAGETAAFYVSVKPGKLTGLLLGIASYKTTYYIGDEYDQTGLTVQGVYTYGDEVTYQYMSSDAYTVVGFDSSEVTDNLVLTVQYNDDTSIYTTYSVTVEQPTPYTITVELYPRLTFSVNEAFTAKGLEFGVQYTNYDVVDIDSDFYYYKNGSSYYKIYNRDVTDDDGTVHEADDVVAATEAEVNAADAYIDVTDYDSSAVGTTLVTIYVSDKFDEVAEKPLELSVSIVESSDYIWKAMLFGASVVGTSDSKQPSSITVNYTDGTSNTSTRKYADVEPELMENGELANVDSVDIVSWDGSGKVTADHDGMAYYYTKVSADNNFSVTADITVNRYVVDPDNLSSTDQATYDGYIAAGYDSKTAIDMMRSGQEAFGIMARDVVPLTGSMQDGVYTGDSNGITNVASEALTQDYTFTKADGSTVTYTDTVDSYESNLGDITVTDEEGTVWTSVYSADAPSNMVIAGATTNGTWPSDPSSSTYYTKTQMNRINIMTRYNSDRIGYYSTTTSLPAKGEVFNVTLKKTNTGYMITTYDYQEDTTSTQYIYSDIEETEGCLTTQDANTIYVGFFAARYADITVDNIEFYETMVETDPTLVGEVNEAVAPKITISSPYYTNYTNYALTLKSNSTKREAGGYTTISLNGKTVKSDLIVGSSKVSVDTVLTPDTVNYFSVVYYPNTADTGFSSYDPVVTRFTVTHKSLDTLNSKDVIYVAGNGSLSGDGTRNNPLTLEPAINFVNAGGKVIMLDGTYNLTNTYEGNLPIDDTLSGYSGGLYKSLVADEGANPVIDLEGEYEGFSVAADYWYFEGFSVINSKDNTNGFVLGGRNCVVENCTFANNGDTGFQISRVNSDDTSIYDWPSYNAVISCESYNNCDPSQNNADGFAAKLTVGYGNVFEDCITHHNVDDGWDLYTKLESGAIGAVVIENCIVYRVGYELDESTGTDALYSSPEGNGFKLGGESIYVEHMLKDCISFRNYNSGVTSNNNPALIVRNVVAYNNGSYNFNLKSGSTTVLTDENGSNKDSSNRRYKFNYDMKGAVSVLSGDSIGSWNDDTGYGNVSTTPIVNETNYLIDATDSSLVLAGVGVNSLGETIDPDTFFVSTDSSTVLDDSMRYSRSEDGSFIHGDYLARAVEYVHDAEDIVTLPDVYGGTGGVGLDATTEATTTETTTTATKTSSSSGSGGGGSVKNYTTTTTTEATTESTDDSSDADTDTDTTTPVVFTDAVSVQIGSSSIIVNDNEYEMGVAPYIQSTSNSTMVPLRFVSIALAGGDVDAADSSDIIVWDAVAKTATITTGSITVVFTAGSGTYTLNGETHNIANQAVAEIVDSRMFVPFRTLGSALGADVSWDADSKTAMYNAE